MAHAAQFGEGGFLHVRRQCFAMPAILVDNLRKTVALLRLGDDAGWLLLLIQRVGVGAIDGVEIVAINFDGVPAESTGASGIGRAVPTEVRFAALAEAVHI